MHDSFALWIRSFLPAPLNASPKEWLRAALGVAIVMPLVFCSGYMLVGSSLTLQIMGPAGASAVLVFVASSSPFAQPWAVLVGNLLAALIGISLGMSGLPSIASLALAACLSLLCLFYLRCLHPPSIALALVAAVGSPELHQLGYALVGPVLFYSALLVAVALVYNNLTGHPYPKPRLSRENSHHTRDLPPGERMSFTHDDVDRA
ncbi:MAG: CBS domain-containing protein, partial [Pseudomonas sp. BICA1-14]